MNGKQILCDINSCGEKASINEPYIKFKPQVTHFSKFTLLTSKSFMYFSSWFFLLTCEGSFTISFEHRVVWAVSAAIIQQNLQLKATISLTHLEGEEAELSNVHSFLLMTGRASLFFLNAQLLPRAF